MAPALRYSSRVGKRQGAKNRSPRSRDIKRVSPFWPEYPRNARVNAFDYHDDLDATRSYYRLRENGRFGSHPLHDAFDDEAAA